MSKNEKAEKLIKTKEALAEKYDRLASLAKSGPKQKHFRYRAEKARRGVRQLSRT